MGQLDSTHGLAGTFRNGTAAYHHQQICIGSFALVALPVCGPRHFSRSRVVQHVPRLSPKVDVMVTYTKKAWSKNKMTEDGLKDKIAKAYQFVNDAMVNSEIHLEINVLGVERVSPGVEHTRHGP